LKRQGQAIEEEGAKIPAYIVTFSDMVTLLLTFFVMLLSLAKSQDPGLFCAGRDSFIEYIENFGIGMLSGKGSRPDFGNVKVKYFISRPDRLFEGRTIDAKEEGIRRIFKEVSRSMRTMPSQIIAKRTNFSVTNIRFPAGDATLNEEAKRFLTKFSFDLQEGPDSTAVGLYVLGLAGDESTEKEQWMLSAKRAQAVADFLIDILPSGLGSQTQYGAFGGPPKWRVYSWGAGPGGNWVVQDSPISKRSQILIAVLRTGD